MPGGGDGATVGSGGGPGVDGGPDGDGGLGEGGLTDGDGGLGEGGLTDGDGGLGEGGLTDGDGGPGGVDDELPESAAAVTRKVDREPVALARPRSPLSSVWISASLSPNLRFSWDGSSRSICRVGDSWASVRKNIRSCVDSISLLHVSDTGYGVMVCDLETEFPGEPGEGKHFLPAQQ